MPKSWSNRDLHRSRTERDRGQRAQRRAIASQAPPRSFSTGGAPAAQANGTGGGFSSSIVSPVLPTAPDDTGAQPIGDPVTGLLYIICGKSICGNAHVCA